MSSSFYKSIIEDEISFFHVNKDSLKAAAKEVGLIYGKKALKEGKTFIDYNITSNRCAYLYKYATIHTSLASKYFSKMIKKKQVKSVLIQKKHLKVCCLGGGPGTDIIGLFKAMAVNPQNQGKVIEVTVLDICGGWRNSFNRVMEKLISGSVKSIPSTFIKKDNFKFQLISVNLLSSLSTDVVSVLSEADIICMVKFVSAISGTPTSVTSIKNIASNLKKDAIVLFIDNFQGNIFERLTDIAEDIGLHMVAEPVHESFNPKNGYQIQQLSAAEKGMFGCFPLYATKVSTLAFIKVTESSEISFEPNICAHTSWILNDKKHDGDGKIATECNISTQTIVAKPSSHICCNQSTQTELTTLQQNINYGPNILDQIVLLFDSLVGLVNTLNEWQQKKMLQNSCHCHSCD